MTTRVQAQDFEREKETGDQDIRRYDEGQVVEGTIKNQQMLVVGLQTAG